MPPARAKRRRDRPPAPGLDDARFVAAVALLGRTGAVEFQIRYCEEELPVVWISAAKWGKHWETAAAMTPIAAVLRLCDQVIDGGQCTHCRRPTGFASDLDTMPLDNLVYWYQYDPSRQTFRRGCAGG